MSNNIKKNLINTLDELLNNAINNTTDQVGGTKFSQKEVDDMLIASLYNIMMLYQKSVHDRKQIKDQIDQILLQHSGIQTGGSKSYSRTEVDFVITNALQQILGLYMQQENERHQLATKFQQLLSQNNNSNKQSLLIKQTNLISVKIPKVSVGAVINYLNEIIPNGSYLQLLIVSDLSKVPKPQNNELSDMIGFFEYHNGDKSYQTQGIEYEPLTSTHYVHLYYKNINVGSITDFLLYKLFKTPNNNRKSLNRYVTGTSNDYAIDIKANINEDGDSFTLKNDIINIIKDFKFKAPINDPIDLSSNYAFFNQLDIVFNPSINGYINDVDHPFAIILQLIRAHLQERIDNRNILPDLV
jgi:hypothetical protein